MSQLFRVEQSERTSDDYLTPRWVFDTLGLTFDLDVAAPPWDTHCTPLRCDAWVTTAMFDHAEREWVSLDDLNALPDSREERGDNQ